MERKKKKSHNKIIPTLTFKMFQIRKFRFQNSIQKWPFLNHKGSLPRTGMHWTRRCCLLTTHPKSLVWDLEKLFCKEVTKGQGSESQPCPKSTRSGSHCPCWEGSGPTDSRAPGSLTGPDVHFPLQSGPRA